MSAEAICWRTVFSGQVQVAHRDHRFQTGQCIARRVGVHGGHRSLVARIHGLEHIECFFAADLTDDDAVGSHTQAVDEQLPLPDSSLSFHVGRTGLQTDNVLLRQLQFGRVFDCDDAFVLRNVLRQNVKEGRFTGAGTAGDQDAEARAHRGRKQFHHLGGDALQLNQLVRGQRTGAKTADRQ